MQKPITRGQLVAEVERAEARVQAEAAGHMRSVYRERARLVAFLAAQYPSVQVPGGDPEWPDYTLVFVDLLTGQTSWHIAPDDVDLFGHVAVDTEADGTKRWDGHNTEEKHRRLEECTVRVADFLGRQRAL